MVNIGHYPRVEEYVTQKARGRRKPKLGTRVLLNPHVIVELPTVVARRTAIEQAERLAAAHI